MARKQKGNQPNPKDQLKNGSGSGRQKRKDYRDDDGKRGGAPRVVGFPLNSSGKWQDPQWYNQHPHLLNPVASVAFPYVPGMTVPFTQAPSSDFESVPTNIGGIMTLSWAPSLGENRSKDDPANVVAWEMYGAIRKAYSGKLEADPNDLLIYVAAIASIDAYTAMLKRFYRAASKYTGENWLTPDTLLQSMGLTKAQAVDLQLNRLRLFDIINQLDERIKRLSLPAVFPLFKRWYWLNDHVFKDADTDASQWYVYKQAWFWEYTTFEPSSGITAGCLIPVVPPFYGSTQKGVVEQMYEFGLEMLSTIEASEDAKTISGYFKRAFEGVAEFVPEPLDINSTLEVEYSEEVLTQLQNTQFVEPDLLKLSTDVFTGAFGIFQDPASGNILSQPSLPSAAIVTAHFNAIADNVPLNMRTRTPEPMEVADATRNISIISDFLGATSTLPNGATLTSGYGIMAGTEIFLDMKITMSNSVLQISLPMQQR